MDDKTKGKPGTSVTPLDSGYFWGGGKGLWQRHRGAHGMKTTYGFLICGVITWESLCIYLLNHKYRFCIYYVIMLYVVIKLRYSLLFAVVIKIVIRGDLWL